MFYRTCDVFVDGGRLRVAEWGPPDAPAILAIHGISGSHLVWAAVVDAMPEIRLIAPDLRGRGASSELPGPWGMTQHAVDVIAVIDALGLDSVALMGHSMGGFVANVTAHQYPDRVSGVLLVDGGLTLPLPRGLLLEDAAQALNPPVDRLSLSFPDREAYRAFAATHPALQENWTPLVEAYVDYDLVGEPPVMRSRTSIDAMRRDAPDFYGPPEVQAAVAAIRPGTTLLVAPLGPRNERPALYTPTALERWRTTLPELNILVIDDVNHYSILIEERSAGIIADHARRLLGS
ncbi:MAG: alpha/beta hydrolase [Rhodoglobus sp.]|uniref:alpha/beta hydrolase n=1 Tax=Salinibacterium sp. G-O1 TaxID=3046208 RepID=UPI0024BAA7AE|nr:alpha/beta fold hydrolase [Salinibacterium sp. G-O1]MDJ0333908.1 alpha/beta fold hydrolase [Salinibacterium sp. G-O1]